ncbi:MAG: FIG00482511: hypothetical protein, partial [uncultured Gemmatimonadaceae bacterium]
DGRPGLLVRRAGVPGGRDLEVPHGAARGARLHRAARGGRDPDGVRGAVGVGEAGDLVRLRHRRHPAGGAEAGRGLPRPDGRGRAGARRGAQRRDAAQHRGRDRREEDHAAREDPRHARALARGGRGADGGQGVPRAGGRVQGRGRHALHARVEHARRVVGPVGGQHARLGDVQVPGVERALRRGAVARQERARRGDAHGAGVGVQARAPRAAAALALRDPRRRRPAQRGAEHGEHLVLLPRARLRPHAGDVQRREEDGAGRGDDDRHAARHRGDGGLGVERPLLAAGGRGDVAQHRAGGDAAVGREGPGARQGDPARARRVGQRARRADAAQRAGGRARPPRRRLRRHRRRELERADDQPALPVEHPQPARAPLGERDLDGDADRAQGRGGRGQGAGDDDARPPAAAQGRGGRVGLLQHRADEDGEVQAVLRPHRQAPGVAERRHHGALPPRDAQVLLRPQEVRDVPGAARDHLPDGAGAEGQRAGGTAV